MAHLDKLIGKTVQVFPNESLKKYFEVISNVYFLEIVLILLMKNIYFVMELH